MFPEESKKLKGFIWREDEQPKKKEDIFLKDGEKDNTPVKKIKPKIEPAIIPKKDKKAKKKIEVEIDQ